MFTGPMGRSANAFQRSAKCDNGFRKSPTRIRSQILHGTPPECDPVICFYAINISLLWSEELIFARASLACRGLDSEALDDNWVRFNDPTTRQMYGK